MRQIIAESKDIILRRTQIEDLDYVLASEREQENAKYVGQWTREQHIDSLSIGDMMHLIVEEAETGKAVGYIIMAGLENPNNSIEFRRIAYRIRAKGTEELP